MKHYLTKKASYSWENFGEEGTSEINRRANRVQKGNRYIITNL